MVTESRLRKTKQETIDLLQICMFICFLRLRSVFIFSVVVAPASNSNGDFGEWNAFPGGQMPASAQTVDNSGKDLFGAITGGPAPAPAPSLNPISAPGSGPASADLFDLMAPTQSLTSSQSLNFSMNSTQSMTTTVLPQSRSQVSMTALICTHPS